jgi:predicted nucleic acid-binding protein
MRRVLLDTNVLLDALLAREPWAKQALAICAANDDGRIRAYLTSTSITDVFYVSRRLVGGEDALSAVRSCLRNFEISTLDRNCLEHALQLSGNDLEDNRQMVCATIDGLDAIVTRDNSGFQAAAIAVLSPDEFLATLN